MNKKVIFLDIDGVMNDDKYIHYCLQNKIDYDESPSKEHLDALKAIIDQTNADIVLSSSWRQMLIPLQKVIDALESIGVHLRGVTPSEPPLSVIQKCGFQPKEERIRKPAYMFGDAVVDERGAEICFWLHTHPEYTSFLILDDDDYDIKDYYPHNFIKTNPIDGLTMDHVKKAVEILERIV